MSAEDTNMIDNKKSSAAPLPMWQGVSDPLPAPDTSMPPRADKPALAGDDLLQRVVMGAHATIDRLADGAAPTVRQLSESVSNAGDALQAKTDQILETQDAWSESLRTAVRNNPLASLAGALVIGVLIARITR